MRKSNNIRKNNKTEILKVSHNLTKAKKYLIVGFCGCLLSLAAFSLDIFLPAFDLMIVDFNTDYANVQLTITIYLFSFGFWQLIFGSISDRFGRKKIILLGLNIFIITSLLSYFSSSSEEFLLYRFLQGIGVGATTVCARSIIRDLFVGKDLVFMMGIVGVVFSIGPILGPVLGGIIIIYFDWYAIIFVVVIIASIIMLMLYFIPETNINKNKNATSFSYIKSSAKELLDNKKTCFYLSVGGLIFALVLFLVINTPVIFFKYFKISGLTFAGYFALQGIGNIFGQSINSQLIKKFSSEQTCIIAGLAIAAIALTLFLLPEKSYNPYLFTFCFAAIIAFFLVLFANVSSLVLDPHGKIIGFTASVFGASSQILSAFIVTTLTNLSNETLGFISLSLVAISSLISFLIATRLFLINSKKIAKNI